MASESFCFIINILSILVNLLYAFAFRHPAPGTRFPDPGKPPLLLTLDSRLTAYSPKSSIAYTPNPEIGKMNKFVIALLVLSFQLLSFADSAPAKLNPTLKLLLSLKNHQYLSNVNDLAPVDKSYIDVSVRFDHELNDGEISSLETGGTVFKRVGGQIYSMINIYALKIPWDRIMQIAERADVISVSADWNPCVHPCLDLSNPEIQADAVWEWEDLNGLPITGEGVLIADFDTGIDVYHPAFFKLSEDTLDWLDVDGDSQFTPGADAVDLNDNDIADPGETLDYLEGEIYDEAATFGGSGGVSNSDGIYQPEWDWLYNDTDDSGQREYGYNYGYTESDPTFGELLFTSLDDNNNSLLDPGEKLIALGESKVYATMNPGEQIRIRGTDIIYSAPDYNGHGTAVSGVLAGGNRGIQRFTGIAPEADIIMGYFFDGVSFSSYLPWVASLGCEILLYEFGGWVFRPLDGSSLEETLLDMTAANGVMQVCPSGNLNRGYKHCLADAMPEDTTYITFEVDEYNGAAPSAVYITILWRNPDNNLNMGLVLPDGSEIMLNGSWSNPQFVDPYAFYSDRWTSERGTAEYDIAIYSDDATGVWQLFVDNNESDTPELGGFMSDNVSSWEGGAEWIDYRSNMKTVTWPSTADSGYVLGSYSTRGYEQYIGVGTGSIQSGQLSKFSGRGPRIDGVPLLSVISPGNYDVYSARSSYGFPGGPGGWRQFSGTSAAGPHVAGAAALLKQGIPDATQFELGQIFEQNAHHDNFTGFAYNDSCGYGKIRILTALANTGVVNFEDGIVTPNEYSLQAYPNPFNAVTNIDFRLPVRGNTELKVFNLLGRQIAQLNDQWLPAGNHSTRFDAEGLSSGVYFVSIQSGKFTAVQKIVLLK